MKLDLICYNRYYKLRRIVLILIYAFLFIIIIGIKGFEYESVFYKWALLIIIGVWIVLYWFVTPYDKVGNISIYKNGYAIIEHKSQCIKVQINTLAFYYGGYKGEMREYEIFYTGTWSRDGTKNFIEINDEKYQLLLQGQADLNSLKSIINELHGQGIEAEFINR